MARNRLGERFSAVVQSRLEPSETIVALARVWTSRPSRFPALAARFRDDAVVTDRRLMVWACGWWTRRARRRVLAHRLDEIVVTNVADTGDGTVRRLRIDHRRRPPIVLDIDRTDESQRFARALLRAGAPATTTAPRSTSAGAPA